MGADLAVVGGALGPQLRHLAEHRDVAAGASGARRDAPAPRASRPGWRCSSRSRATIPPGELDQLAAQAREGYPRRPTRHLGERRRPARPRSRSPPGRSERLCASANGNRNRSSPSGRARSWPRVERPSRRAGNANTSPPAPKVIVTSRSWRWGSSASASAGTTARPAPAEPGEDLGLGLGDRLQGPEELEVDRPDVGDRADLRLGDPAELGDLPAAAHRHLEDQRLGLRRRAEDRQRQPDLGVEVLRAGVHPHRQDRAADVLDRRLADRAGDPHHRAAELAPPGAGEPLEAGERILGRRAPSRRRPRRRSASAPTPARRPPPRRPPRSPPRRTRLPSARSPRRPKNRSPRPHLAGVDHRARRAPAPARGGSPRRRSRQRSDRERARSRARPACGAVRSSSAGDLRSSKGIFRPPANSWPCSCPLPAITTVSPRLGLGERQRRSPRGGPARRWTVPFGSRSDPGQDLVDDRLRLLGARVVGGDHAGVGEPRARSRPSGGASRDRGPRRSRTPRSAVRWSACAPRAARSPASRACGRSRRGPRTAGPPRPARSAPAPDRRRPASAAAASARARRAPRRPPIAASAFSTLKWPGQGGPDRPPPPPGRDTETAIPTRRRRRRGREGRPRPIHSARTVSRRRADPSAQLGREPGAVGVVDVHDRGPGAPPRHEQRPLRLEVLLHVAVEVEVVLGQVGEHGDREPDPGGSVEGQRVRGDLHRAGPVARLEHPAKGRLEIDRLRRRPLDLLLDPTDHLLDGPEEPGPDPLAPRARGGSGRRWSSSRWCR